MSLEELYFAIRLGAGQLETGFWDRKEVDYDRMKRFVLHCTRGLIRFTRFDTTTDSCAQFIHETVKDYLLADGLTRLDSDLWQDAKGLCHLRLAQWCFNYVKLDPLAPFSWDASSGKYSAKFPFSWDAHEAAFHHMDIAREGGRLMLAAVNDFPVNAWACLQNIFDFSSEAKVSENATALYYILEGHLPKLADALLEHCAIPRDSRQLVVSSSILAASEDDIIAIDLDTNHHVEETLAVHLEWLPPKVSLILCGCSWNAERV